MGLGEVGLEPDRLAELGDRLLQLPLLPQGVAEVVVGERVVGLEPDRRAEFGDRVIQLPLGFQGVAEATWACASSGSSRIAARNSAIASSCFPWSARARPRLSWAKASSGSSRIAVAVFGDRLLQLPLVGQGVTEVVVGHGVVGPEPDRRAELGDRLLELPLVGQGDAEMEMGLGKLGLDPDRRAEFGDRLLQLALGVQIDAAAVVSNGAGHEAARAVARRLVGRDRGPAVRARGRFASAMGSASFAGVRGVREVPLPRTRPMSR